MLSPLNNWSIVLQQAHLLVLWIQNLLWIWFFLSCVIWRRRRSCLLSDRLVYQFVIAAEIVLPNVLFISRFLISGGSQLYILIQSNSFKSHDVFFERSHWNSPIGSYLTQIFLWSILLLFGLLNCAAPRNLAVFQGINIALSCCIYSFGGLLLLMVSDQLSGCDRSQSTLQFIVWSFKLDYLLLLFLRR